MRKYVCGFAAGVLVCVFVVFICDCQALKEEASTPTPKAHVEEEENGLLPHERPVPEPLEEEPVDMEKLRNRAEQDGPVAIRPKN